MESTDYSAEAIQSKVAKMLDMFMVILDQMEMEVVQTNIKSKELVQSEEVKRLLKYAWVH